jgi:hypothetical protein
VLQARERVFNSLLFPCFHLKFTFESIKEFGSTSTDKPWTNMDFHKTHHGPNLGEATTFPFIVFSLLGHGAYTHMSFCLRTPKLGVLKFSKLGLLQVWRLITFCSNLRLKWGFNQSCIVHRELFNDMWHATYTQVNQGDSRLLVVKSQIGNLTLDIFFGHNLCFKYPNGSCEFILDIYVPRTF